MRARARLHRETGTRGGTESVIYGWHSVLAALRNPQRRIRRLLATPNALRRLQDLGIGDLPQPADPREIDRIAGLGAVHQGIAVLCDPLPERDVSELAEARLVLVLDQVTDPHNVGAVLRSGGVFGCDAVILTARHGPAETGVLAKAASGALEHVPLVRVPNLARALDQLAALGFHRLGLDSAHAEFLQPAGDTEKIALVLGAEGKGLRRLTREKCDRLVAIDVPGPLKSLNVSNAAAVALYALRRHPAAPAPSPAR